MHDLRLIHTDLKPENILLVSSESIRVPDYKVVTKLLSFYLLLYGIYRLRFFLGHISIIIFLWQSLICHWRGNVMWGPPVWQWQIRDYGELQHQEFLWFLCGQEFDYLFYWRIMQNCNCIHTSLSLNFIFICNEGFYTTTKGWFFLQEPSKI
jgi:serine/threonine protein kinase